jgi:hypothetical protein
MKRLLIGLGVIAFLLPQYCEGSPIDEIINETLNVLEPFVPNNSTTKNLLKLTAAVETDYGKNTKNNSSIGVWQLTKTTMNEIQVRIKKQEDLKERVDLLKTKSTEHYHAALAILIYSIRINLYNIKIAEEPNNIEILTLAVIWKEKYNTHKGDGCPIKAYSKFKYYTRKEMI